MIVKLFLGFSGPEEIISVANIRVLEDGGFLTHAQTVDTRLSFPPTGTRLKTYACSKIDFPIDFVLANCRLPMHSYPYNNIMGNEKKICKQEIRYVFQN